MLPGVIGQQDRSPSRDTCRAAHVDQVHRAAVAHAILRESRLHALQAVTNHGEGLFLQTALGLQFVQRADVCQYTVGIQVHRFLEDYDAHVIEIELLVDVIRIRVDRLKFDARAAPGRIAIVGDAGFNIRLEPHAATRGSEGAVPRRQHHRRGEQGAGAAPGRAAVHIKDHQTHVRMSLPIGLPKGYRCRRDDDCQQQGRGDQ